MTTKETLHTSKTMRPTWVYYLLILLVVEKIIQHIFVTLAFYFNWWDIASTVVVSPAMLMVLGAIIAVLFIVSLWGMIAKRAWTINLLIFLALFDIIGEFVAQGKIAITLNVSFIVATLLLILSLAYRRQIKSLSEYSA